MKTLNDVVDIFSCCILTWNAVTVMLPAFMLASAIAVFVPPPVVLRHFGGGSRKWLAYALASLSGLVLAICSCNVVPLFRSVYRRGAGLGPAITFLYAGPAIHIVTLAFTIKVIGWRVGVWRAIAVPMIAVLVGLIMAAVFRREEAARQEEHATAPPPTMPMHPARHLVPFFIGLVVTMLVGGVDQKQVGFMTWPVRIPVMVTLAGIVAIMAVQWFERDELKEWGLEAWKLVRMMVPILLVSVLVIGYIAKAVPLTTLQHLGLTSKGGNSVGSALMVSAFSAFMYFPVLTEVAFAKAFMKLNDMPPSLGLIIMLTGAGLSLPGQILIVRVLGFKKLAVYVLSIIVLSAAAGLIFGHLIGPYICPCTQ